MRRFSLLDAICGVVLSQRSQRNCIMTDSLRSHKNGNPKRLPAGDVSSGKLWIVLRRAYHSVVGFLESGITALWVGLWVGKMARTLLSSYCVSRPIESDLKLIRRPYRRVIHVSAWRRCLSQKCANKKVRVCGGYRKVTARIPVHSNRWLIPDVTPRIALSGNE